jgi:hypothetical protein
VSEGRKKEVIIAKVQARNEIVFTQKRFVCRIFAKSFNPKFYFESQIVAGLLDCTYISEPAIPTVVYLEWKILVNEKFDEKIEFLGKLKILLVYAKNG